MGATGAGATVVGATEVISEAPEEKDCEMVGAVITEIVETVVADGRWKRVRRGLGLPTLVVVVVCSDETEAEEVPEALEPDGRWKRVRRGLGLPT